MEIKTVSTIVWSEIGQSLSRETRVKVCACMGAGFCRYLASEQSLPFSIIPSADFKDRPHGEVGLFLGWKLPEGPTGSARLEQAYNLLKDDGEARFFGWYRFPTSDDILLWERKCGKRGAHLPLDWPPPEAARIGEITALIKTSSFRRFSVRKRGIYYQAVLRKLK